VPKTIFTFPEDDDPIFSSAFVVVSPKLSKRSTATSEPLPPQPECPGVTEANRATREFDAPDKSEQ
jgi:hypothetical protein